MMQSLPIDTIKRPLGVNLQLSILSWCTRSKQCIYFIKLKDQTLISPVLWPVMKTESDELKFKLWISEDWAIDFSHLFLLVSHNLTVLSLDPDNNLPELPVKQSPLIQSVCPCSVRTYLWAVPPCNLSKVISRSVPAHASIEPTWL